MTLRASDVIRLHMGHFIAPGHLPFAGAAVVVDAFLIRHSSGPVLLDTGLGVVAISMAVFGFNLFGDSLRDALDPRLRTG